MNDRSPTVERLADDTSKRLVLPERNVRRLGRSTTGTSSTAAHFRVKFCRGEGRGVLCQQSDLVVCDAQPAKAGKRVRDVVLGSQVVDQPYRRSQPAC